MSNDIQNNSTKKNQSGIIRIHIERLFQIMEPYIIDAISFSVVSCNNLPRHMHSNFNFAYFRFGSRQQMIHLGKREGGETNKKFKWKLVFPFFQFTNKIWNLYKIDENIFLFITIFGEFNSNKISIHFNLCKFFGPFSNR